MWTIFVDMILGISWWSHGKLINTWLNVVPFLRSSWLFWHSKPAQIANFMLRSPLVGWVVVRGAAQIGQVSSISSKWMKLILLHSFQHVIIRAPSIAWWTLFSTLIVKHVHIFQFIWGKSVSRHFGAHITGFLFCRPVFVVYMSNCLLPDCLN